MKTLHSQATLVLPGAGEQLSVIGDRQTIKLDGSHTNGAFALIEQNNEPGTSMPEHFHTQEDEIFYVLEGEIEFTVSKEKIAAAAGTTVFLPKGIPHSFKVGEKGGVSVYGLGRFPVTLYYEQWIRLLDAATDLRAFLEENKSRLKLKDQQ